MTGATMMTSVTDKGYIVEMSLPVTPLNFPASEEWKEGRPIKMSVLINDKDDPKASGRKIVLGWAFSPDGANYRDTSGWQTLRLVK
jgi:hypothetical protein